MANHRVSIAVFTLHSHEPTARSFAQSVRRRIRSSLNGHLDIVAVDNPLGCFVSGELSCGLMATQLPIECSSCHFVLNCTNDY
jgi:hypothetical protein